MGISVYICISMRRIILLLFLILFALPGQLFARPIAPVWRDVAYKTVDSLSMKLDIYLPPDTTLSRPYPVIVYIHGGSWVTGSKEAFVIPYMEEVLRAVLDEGYAVVSIEYLLADTLSGEASFPRAIADCKDAIRWVRAHAGECRLDPHRIGLWGSSAGAHLSLLAAYTPDTLFRGDALLSRYSAQVDYVIDDYGPTHLNKLFRTHLDPLSLGLVKMAAPALYREREMMLSVFSGDERRRRRVNSTCRYYSPMTYVGEGAVPTLLLHGDKDKVVPLKQSRKLARALAKADTPHRLVVYPGAGHSFRTFTTEEIDDIRRNVLDFLHACANKNTEKP